MQWDREALKLTLITKQEDIEEPRNQDIGVFELKVAPITIFLW